VDLSNLVMTDSLPWYRWPIEIDGLPIKNGGSFHGKLLVITSGFRWACWDESCECQMTVPRSWSVLPSYPETQISMSIVTVFSYLKMTGWWCNVPILKNMSSSMGRMTSHILRKIKNVPNHQPDEVCQRILHCYVYYACFYTLGSMCYHLALIWPQSDCVGRAGKCLHHCFDLRWFKWEVTRKLLV